MNEAEIVLIPDIHGRTFWKDAVKGRENNPIIFCGDYMDPYDDECIGYNKAKKNFKEIIEFANSRYNVTLLLGNHDCHYLCGIEHSSRYDFFHVPEIREVFKSYKGTFKIATERTIDGKRFIFSHAGLSRTQFNNHELLFRGIDWDKINVVDWVNNAWDVKDGHFIHILDDISFRRGGFDNLGSVIWADILDHYVDGKGKNLFGDYQIFGHTQLVKDPIIFDKFACVDCRRAFILNDKGKICELDGKEIELTKEGK